MSYRINSTGRKRIRRESIRIRLAEQGNGLPPRFTAEISLDSGLNLDPDARVYLEAYVKSSSMRFDFGTVAAISPPERCVLSDIDAGAYVLFRLKVVAVGTPAGKVLASADGIRPTDDSGDKRKSLLPLRTLDIGEEIWRLEVDKDSGPSLILNSRLPGIADRLKTDLLLQGAIYPEIVRQLAQRILREGGEYDEEDSQWVEDWKKWFRDVLKRDDTDWQEPSDDEGVTQLADDLAEAFARRNSFATGAIDAQANRGD